MNKLFASIILASTAGLTLVSAASAATLSYYDPSHGANGGAQVSVVVADEPQSADVAPERYSTTRLFYDISEKKMVVARVGQSTAPDGAPITIAVRDSRDSNIAAKSAVKLSASPLK